MKMGCDASHYINVSFTVKDTHKTVSTDHTELPKIKTAVEDWQLDSVEGREDSVMRGGPKDSSSVLHPTSTLSVKIRTRTLSVHH